MRESKLTFGEGFLGIDAQKARKKGNIQKAFDWDKAATLIKERLVKHPQLEAEAGLEGDWACTGGYIFTDGKPNNDSYTYLSSNWATPTLIITSNSDSESFECYVEENDRMHSDTKWDKTSLEILGVSL